MKTVYLAGAITDCDNGEANDWRRNLTHRLSTLNIAGISPLRCEPLMGERYTLTNQDPRFGTARAIASKNFLDVQTCDLTLCYMPKIINERRLSIGTIIELAWAHSMRKPTILVSDYDFVTSHPVVQANASWILDSMDDAMDVIAGVFGDYAR
jgi:hypothetical protein